MTEKKHFSIKLITRGAVIRIAVLFIILSFIAGIGGCMMISMPGKTYSGLLPELTEDEILLRKELERDVRYLADTIGVRNFEYPEGLKKAARFIEESFQQAGYSVKLHEYRVKKGLIDKYWESSKYSEQVFTNIEIELAGVKSPKEIIVVGAHYDSVCGEECRAANDNGSGIAALLALARRFAVKKPLRTIRFVAFVNEEPPLFQTDGMGSLVYAKKCRADGDNIVGMLSLETIGYYTDREESQHYPFPLNYFYPSKGNFIGFVGNTASRAFVKKCVGIFREKVKFPSEGAALPGIVPEVGWSDHWSFWKAGYPALMITDTAPFRYPYYHQTEDTPDKLNYESMVRVVKGIERLIEESDLADEKF